MLRMNSAPSKDRINHSHFELSKIDATTNFSDFGIKNEYHAQTVLILSIGMLVSYTKHVNKEKIALPINIFFRVMYSVKKFTKYKHKLQVKLVRHKCEI